MMEEYDKLIMQQRIYNFGYWCLYFKDNEALDVVKVQNEVKRPYKIVNFSSQKKCKLGGGV